VFAQKTITQTTESSVAVKAEIVTRDFTWERWHPCLHGFDF